MQEICHTLKHLPFAPLLLSSVSSRWETVFDRVVDTTSESYLRDHRISFRSYKTAPEGLLALGDDKIKAFVYDEPILRYLVNKSFKGALRVLNATFERQDYGIVLPQGSPLRESINRALLEKIRVTEWQDTLYKYLGH